MTWRLRERRPDDVGVLCQVLLEQRPTTGYPASMPPEGPAALIVRQAEVGAWVVVGDDDVPVAHVSVTRAGVPYADSEEEQQWATAHGVDSEKLGVVSALFVAVSARRQGLARLLMEQATQMCWDHGLRPCLDVCLDQPGAGDLHTSLGWETVGTVTPFWLPEGRGPVVTMIHRGAQSSGSADWLAGSA